MKKEEIEKQIKEIELKLFNLKSELKNCFEKGDLVWVEATDGRYKVIAKITDVYECAINTKYFDPKDNKHYCGSYSFECNVITKLDLD